MQNLFVYGTLMKGQGAHERLNDATLIGNAILRDFELIDLGSFPGIRPRVGGSVVGELYEVDDELIKNIDMYEGEGTLYDREPVRVCIYDGKYSDEFPAVLEHSYRSYAYIYKEQSEHHEKLDCKWGTAGEDYVWYAAYGSNIDEDRFKCYIEGGKCSANGRTYEGCRDKSRWIGEDIALYPGTVYSSNNSSSWNGKGVAFYDENERRNFLKGNAFMRLYKIRRRQLEDIQRQEGKSPNWYGRVVAVGVHNDGIPVYTFTSEQKGIYSEPDLAYISLIRDATRRVCDQYDISVDCGLETALILMARNPRYEEKPLDKKKGSILIVYYVLTALMRRRIVHVREMILSVTGIIRKSMKKCLMLSDCLTKRDIIPMHAVREVLGTIRISLCSTAMLHLMSILMTICLL